MRVLALLATLSFVGVGGVVGVQLLLLARRTRQLPELTVGLGLFLIAWVGYPRSLASLAPDLSPVSGEAPLRRRHPGHGGGLGLSDPVVANRFLLWGISGIAATLGTGVSTAMVFAGSAHSGAHPVSLLAVGLAGLTSSVVLYLAFRPPAAWRRFVAGRALARTL